jgi:prevent-host-death family protein
MVQMNVHEAKNQLPRLIEAALAGQPVTIVRAGKPVVDLVPHRGTQVTFGVDGWTDFRVDPDVVDGADPEVADLFYGAHAGR